MKKVLPITAMLLIALVWGCNKDAGMSSDLSSSNLKAGGLPVDLGVAGDFVILAQSAITDVPLSDITGNVGLSPAAGSYIAGLTCPEVAGLIYTAAAGGPACETVDATKLGTAVLDFGTASTDAFARAYKADANHLNLGAGELGGLTLAAGVYHWDDNVTISTDVTLKGGANDVWIFQIPGTLIMSSAVKITLAGAQAANIFWVVGGAVTLGSTSHFEGNILGQTGITLVTGASINGRLLAGTQVALQMATVTQVAQTKKACEGILNAEKTVFDANQRTAKLAFDAVQKSDKLAFQLTHPTAAQLKTFTLAQAAAKLIFVNDQKADKLAFTLQQKIDMQECSTLR